MKFSLPVPATVLAFALASPAAEPAPAWNDAAWVAKHGTVIFHETFDREEMGNGAKAIGNGWNSATADRVPEIKQADLDAGILKITNAPAAGHQPHLHHEAGFQDGAALVRFRLPGLSKAEDLTVGFVDREVKTAHAGHLCYAFIRTNPPAISVVDYLTGEMNLANRTRKQAALAAGGKVPEDLAALYLTKKATERWAADQQWHDLLLAVEGDELRASLDGKPLVRHRSQGFAHPMKRWISLLANSTAWVDEVKVWRVK